jgi:hypothetical protein
VLAERMIAVIVIVLTVPLQLCAAHITIGQNGCVVVACCGSLAQAYVHYCSINKSRQERSKEAYTFILMQ